MDTDKLIAELSSQPIARKPLKPTLAAALLWLLSAVFFLAVIGAYIGFRDDLKAMLLDTERVAEVTLLGLSAVLSTYAALGLRYPQMPMLLKNKLILNAVAAIWLSLTLIHMPALTLASVDVLIAELSHVFNECMIELCAISVMPAAYIAYLSKKGATTNKAAMGFACTMAAASLGALLMRLLCPDDGHIHLFLWHFLPVLVLAALGTALGRVLFRW